LLDAVPLWKKGSDDVRSDDVCFGCAAAPKYSIAFVNEDDRRPMSPGMVPYFANSPPAGSKVLLLYIGKRKVLKVAAQSFGKRSYDQRLARTCWPVKQKPTRSRRITVFKQLHSAKDNRLCACFALVNLYLHRKRLVQLGA
jgi:hypothetical protein